MKLFRGGLRCKIKYESVATRMCDLFQRTVLKLIRRTLFEALYIKSVIRNRKDSFSSNLSRSRCQDIGDYIQNKGSHIIWVPSINLHWLLYAITLSISQIPNSAPRKLEMGEPCPGGPLNFYLQLFPCWVKQSQFKSTQQYLRFLHAFTQNKS